MFPKQRLNRPIQPRFADELTYAYPTIGSLEPGSPQQGTQEHSSRLYLSTQENPS